jgi:hypothetical protein
MKMKTIVPLAIIGILLLGSVAVVAHTEPEKTAEIVEVKGGIGKISYKIENTCEIQIYGLECEVNVNGGILNTIGITDTTIVKTLGFQATETSKTNDFIFGFGKIDISIDVEYADTWTGEGFIVGPVLFGIKEI